MVKVVDKVSSLSEEKASNVRFERKFVFSNVSREWIVQRVLLNSFGFNEIFHQRKVNNIYFDDSNYSFYKQNVEGVADRKKIRLRWYGDKSGIVENPTIEIKKKMGETGDKENFPLKGVTYNLMESSLREVQLSLLEKVAEKSLTHTLSGLHATLVNTYERRYFLSFCGRYRITIDFNQNFYNPNANFSIFDGISTNNIVLELKYALQDDFDARQISQEFGTRLSKNSKYVNGVNLLYHPVFV